MTFTLGKVSGAQLAEFIRFLKMDTASRFMVRIRLSPPRSKSLSGLDLRTFRHGELCGIFRDFVAPLSRLPSGRRQFLPTLKAGSAVSLISAWDVVRRSPEQMRILGERARLETETDKVPCIFPC